MRIRLGWPLVSVFLVLSCNSEKSTKPVVGPPPATVQDLVARSRGAGAILLTWTAPGAHGTEGQAQEYDIRSSMQPMATGGWGSGLMLDHSRVPKSAGQAESLLVTGLANRAWYLAMKSSNSEGTWSALSNEANVAMRDTIPPNRVTDLATTATRDSSIALTWTAPGDDGPVGRASAYDLRYSESLITEGTWSAATRIQTVPAPGVSGSPESLNVRGLRPGHGYFFALKAHDSAPNWSELSNTVNDSTWRKMRVIAGITGQYIEHPGWSPDGRYLIYGFQDGHATPQIYRVPIGGGQATAMTSGMWPASNPGISPDGRFIAFETDSIVCTPTPCRRWVELWRMNATDGSQLAHLTTIFENSGYGVSWSPDGQIAFATVSPSEHVSKIYTMASTGGTPVLRAGGGSDWAREPSWSPDGTHIAFVGTVAGVQGIWVMPASGGNAVRIAENADCPSWSPDGGRIAFTRGDNQQTHLWVMSSSGANQTQLTTGDVRTYSPTWSPDGTGIAYRIVTKPAETGDLWIIFPRL